MKEGRGSGIQKIVAVLTAGLICGVIAMFGLASQSEAAMSGSLRVAALVHGIYKMPNLTRHPACSLGTAFQLSSSAEEAIARQTYERRCHVKSHDGALDLVETPDGDFWIPRRDYPTLMEELAEQTHDDYDLAQRVHRGDIALDCGANLGLVSKRLLALGASRVIAVEPGPEPLECLRRNLRGEIASGRVTLYPKGVWDKEDQLTLSHGDELATSAASVALERGGKGVVVPLTTIDHLVEELGLERVDFIKMDIEGAEPNALRGAANSIRRFKPRMAIALEHRPTDPDTLPALIRQLDPSARVWCGPCAKVNSSIQPNVMFVN